LLGLSAVIREEQRSHGAAVGELAIGLSDNLPKAWEHTALARVALRLRDVNRASDEVRAAVRESPLDQWPNYYFGMCALAQSRYAEAIAAFSVCLGASPRCAACLCYRGQAFAGLELSDAALRDFDEALRLNPELATAALGRGRLYLRSGRWKDAATDFALGLRLQSQEPPNPDISAPHSFPGMR
jgi:eukaryotic-like serine/threonine-protein kinase